MIYCKKSSRTPEEVDSRLREAAQRHKFGVLNVLDLKSTLQSKGIDFQNDCRVYDVCNPQAASQALGANLSASAVLPCRISVFHDASGTTIATVKPIDLLKSTGLSGVDDLAAQVEREIVAIIDESA
ncbi:MAG: DUF302 domain-containing protein [Terriglobia bacterium]|nr:DUF302 domain-containing protein [Terriglobia bacterium]